MREAKDRDGRATIELSVSTSEASRVYVMAAATDAVLRRCRTPTSAARCAPPQVADGLRTAPKLRPKDWPPQGQRIGRLKAKGLAASSRRWASHGLCIDDDALVAVGGIRRA